MSTKPKPSPTSKEVLLLLDSPKVKLWRTMLLSVEMIYEELGRKLNQKNCSYPRFRVLFALYFDGPLSASQLASRTRVSRANMSSFVRRLAEDDLIAPCASTSTR